MSLGAFLGLGGIVLLFFVYQPLFAKVGKRSFECIQWETQAREARKSASSSWGEKKLNLVSENDISAVTDKITRKGKDKNVSFLSISPHPIEKMEGSPLRILPIDLETRSSCQALGGFLGEVQEMESAFMTVRSLEAKADSSNPEAVRAHMTLHVYLAS